MPLLANTASVLLVLAAVSAPAPPTFAPATRAVSTWRQEALDNLVLGADQMDAMRNVESAPPVARCVKLNNYWCVKRAGWNGEIAADGDGHVAFASAKEGAAVAAILLRRYYIDLDRKTALAIVSHWAPARCGIVAAPPAKSAATGPVAVRAPARLGRTLRARWLAGHTRGFVTVVGGRGASTPRRSVVADPVGRLMPIPAIARGLAMPTKPMTLDALLRASPNAPPSRSMIGMPYKKSATAPVASPFALGRLTGCGIDGARIASYAAKAAAGITVSGDGDLGLFKPDGTPTPNLAIVMENMARVEIGPLGAKPSLIAAGIAAAFEPGRNPDRP